MTIISRADFFMLVNGVLTAISYQKNCFFIDRCLKQPQYAEKTAIFNHTGMKLHIRNAILLVYLPKLNIRDH